DIGLLLIFCVYAVANGIVACVAFFFQAEDGIRDGHVTGVQTCALPIFGSTSYCAARSRTKATAARTSAACSAANWPPTPDRWLNGTPTMPRAARCSPYERNTPQSLAVAMISSGASPLTRNTTGNVPARGCR